jgi:hypothetical protein
MAPERAYRCYVQLFTVAKLRAKLERENFLPKNLRSFAQTETKFNFAPPS